MERESTDRSRKSPTTSVTVGRRAGSRCQQLSVIFHIEPVRPSSRAPRERVGRSPLVIFKMMIGSVQPLNGYFPVKTLTETQPSGERTIPLPPALSLGKHKDRPLSRPYQKKKCPLLAWLCLLSQEPPARPTPQYIPSPSSRERSSIHERPRRARNPSNERCRCGQREC